MLESLKILCIRCQPSKFLHAAFSLGIPHDARDKFNIYEHSLQLRIRETARIRNCARNFLPIAVVDGFF